MVEMPQSTAILVNRTAAATWCCCFLAAAIQVLLVGDGKAMVLAAAQAWVTLVIRRAHFVHRPILQSALLDSDLM
jgi:hypothetical protein